MSDLPTPLVVYQAANCQINCALLSNYLKQSMHPATTQCEAQARMEWKNFCKMVTGRIDKPDSNPLIKINGNLASMLRRRFSGAETRNLYALVENDWSINIQMAEYDDADLFAPEDKARISGYKSNDRYIIVIGMRQTSTNPQCLAYDEMVKKIHEALICEFPARMPTEHNCCCCGSSNARPQEFKFSDVQDPVVFKFCNSCHYACCYTHRCHPFAETPLLCLHGVRDKLRQATEGSSVGYATNGGSVTAVGIISVPNSGTCPIPSGDLLVAILAWLETLSECRLLHIWTYLSPKCKKLVATKFWPQLSPECLPFFDMIRKMLTCLLTLHSYELLECIPPAFDMCRYSFAELESVAHCMHNLYDAMRYTVHPNTNVATEIPVTRPLFLDPPAFWKLLDALSQFDDVASNDFVFVEAPRFKGPTVWSVSWSGDLYKFDHTEQSSQGAQAIMFRIGLRNDPDSDLESVDADGNNRYEEGTHAEDQNDSSDDEGENQAVGAVFRPIQTLAHGLHPSDPDLHILEPGSFEVQESDYGEPLASIFELVNKHVKSTQTFGDIVPVLCRSGYVPFATERGTIRVLENQSGRREWEPESLPGTPNDSTSGSLDSRGSWVTDGSSDHLRGSDQSVATVPTLLESIFKALELLTRKYYDRVLPRLHQFLDANDEHFELTMSELCNFINRELSEQSRAKAAQNSDDGVHHDGNDFIPSSDEEPSTDSYVSADEDDTMHRKPPLRRPSTRQSRYHRPY
jgi:hypothetical protein